MRISDIQSLNQGMPKIVKPAGIPKFGSINYLKTSSTIVGMKNWTQTQLSNFLGIGCRAFEYCSKISINSRCRHLEYQVSMVSIFSIPIPIWRIKERFSFRSPKIWFIFYKTKPIGTIYIYFCWKLIFEKLEIKL